MTAHSFTIQANRPAAPGAVFIFDEPKTIYAQIIKGSTRHALAQQVPGYSISIVPVWYNAELGTANLKKQLQAMAHYYLTYHVELNKGYYKRYEVKK